MPFQVGPLEVIVLLIIVLLIFGPKRLPEMGRSLGRGIREFKSSLNKEEIQPSVIERSTDESPSEPLKGEVTGERKVK